MARDYSKPGNTPPGTKHEAPKRREHKTWLDFVAPAAGYAPKDPPKLEETVEFTRMVDGELVTEIVPTESVIEGRRAWNRMAERNRERRQRKGQRQFYRQQLAAERRS